MPLQVLAWHLDMKVAQLHPTLCDPMDCIVHGILQARILEWVAFPFSRGSYQTQESNPGLPHCWQILYQLSHKGSPKILEWVACPFSSRSSRPKSRTGVSCIAGRFFTNWAVREAMRGVWVITPRKNQSLSAKDLFTSWHVNTLVWFFVLL